MGDFHLNYILISIHRLTFIIVVFGEIDSNKASYDFFRYPYWLSPSPAFDVSISPSLINAPSVVPIYVLSSVVPLTIAPSNPCHTMVSFYSLVSAVTLGSPRTSEDLKLRTSGEREHLAFIFLDLGYLPQYDLL